MPEYEKSPGAVWKKQGKKGEYLSISIDIDGVKHSFVAFQNERKKSDNSPDYWIQPPRDREAPPF